MRRHCKLIAAIGVALLLGGPALAQFGPRGGGGLISNASVQKELKLTDEQIDKVKSVVKDVGTKMKDDRPGKDATPEQRAEFAKKLADATMKALGDVLKPEQVKRLKEIELQRRGPSDPDAQKALQFTDEQKSKLKEIAEKLTKDREDVRKNTEGQERFEKMNKLTKESKEKELALLTDAQKKQWKEMTGEPFEVKFERPQ